MAKINRWSAAVPKRGSKILFEPMARCVAFVKPSRARTNRRGRLNRHAKYHSHAIGLPARNSAVANFAQPLMIEPHAVHNVAFGQAGIDPLKAGIHWGKTLHRTMFDRTGIALLGSVLLHRDEIVKYRRCGCLLLVAGGGISGAPDVRPAFALRVGFACRYEQTV